AEIRKKLNTSRLVSLVGPGGVGKTRLALRAAADLARGFADGAWLVELAEIRDGALVADAVLAALDLRDQAALTPMQILVSQLEDKQVLLVLDNCEHLIDAAARLVVGVLRAAPKLRVITTSREPREVRGGRPPLPAARRSATGDRAGGGADPDPDGRADPRSPGSSFCPSDRGRSCCAPASSDASRGNRLELRPLDDCRPNRVEA